MKAHPLLIAALIAAAQAPLAWADPVMEEFQALRAQVQQLAGTVEQLQTTVTAQQERIRSLESKPQQLAQQPAPPQSRSVPIGLQAMNPEIGVVADIVGQASESSQDGEGNDKFSALELELVFGHPIDPYSRLDATIAFSDFEEPSLEEAYITHWGLPAEVKARLGRLRPKIGKAAAMHRDSLDTVDEPLVVTRYLGAEGLSRTAMEFSSFLPLPWTSVTHEIAAGMMEGGVGEGATLFGETRRRPSYYAHLKNFWDISDETNVELGGTYLLGSSDADAHAEVNAFGADATLVHFFTPTQKFKWQSELYVQNRDEHLEVSVDPSSGEETTTIFEKNPWGVYSLLDFRLSPRFGLGGRFDYVEPVNLDPATIARDGDTAWASYLTFYQSEFTRWRLQYKHTDFAQGGDDDTVFVQGTVAIGVHKHALQ